MYKRQEPISLYNSAVFQGGATEQMRRVLSLEQMHAASSDYTAAIKMCIRDRLYGTPMAKWLLGKASNPNLAVIPKSGTEPTLKPSKD